MVEHVNGTPVLVNDEAMTRFAHRVAEQQFGDDRAHYGARPLMGSEDFAFMLDAHPQGCYLIIGNGDGEAAAWCITRDMILTTAAWRPAASIGERWRKPI